MQEEIAANAAARLPERLRRDPAVFLAELPRTVTSLITEVTELGAYVTHSKNEVVQLSRESEGLKEQLEELNTKLQLSDDLALVHQLLALVQNKTKELRNKSEELRNKSEELGNKSDELKNKAEELENKIKVNSALITTVEGLAVVVNGARCHYADPRVQAAVLLALTPLMTGAGDWVRGNGQTVDSNIGKLFELGALEAALAAMSAHAAERAVQAAACGMLKVLVRPSPHATAICARFVELGGIASVMGALDAFPRDRELVTDAVGPLHSLMIGDKARTAQIIALGGMERMIMAMDNHPDGGLGVCYEAVSALQRMSLAGQEAQERLAALGVAARVRAAMAAPDVSEYTTKNGQQLLDVLPVDRAHQEAASAGSAGAASIEAANSVKEEAMLLQLAEMGFSDGSANKELLEELNFDIGAVIERLAINAQTSDSAEPSTQQQQQQLLSRLSDVASEPLGLLTPITGISGTPRQPLMDAAVASGVADMDAHGFVAAEHGAALARDDAHGLDADEAGALSLYTFESELYKILNDLLRQRDRQRLKPFFPYLKLLIDARRKLPRHVGTVWRGVKGVDLRSKYQKGSEVYWWAFSSTTKELSTLHNPNFLGTSGVRTVFNIQVKRMK